MNQKVSKAVQEQAIKVAKGTQKKGQTKEQTKLIAQGIEKGIAEYKKQQSKKARERDKQRKQELKEKQRNTIKAEENEISPPSTKLPWVLLTVSWLGFIAYIFINN